MKIVFLAFIAMIHFSCAKVPPKSEGSSEQTLISTKEPEDVPRLANAVCRSDLTFVSCLKLSKQACISEATRFERHCESKIAKASGSPDEFGRRGMALGMCIEESLLNGYGEQGLKTPECIKSQGLQRIQNFRKSESKYVW